jgi:hypothetical protein
MDLGAEGARGNEPRGARTTRKGSVDLGRANGVGRWGPASERAEGVRGNEPRGTGKIPRGLCPRMIFDN